MASPDPADLRKRASVLRDIADELDDVADKLEEDVSRIDELERDAKALQADLDDEVARSERELDAARQEW